MKKFGRKSLAATLALIGTCGLATAQTGSVMSDISNPEVIAKHRAEAAERIKCDIPEDWDAQMAMFAADGDSKWDRAKMGCAIEAGAEAVRDLSIPSNAIWAFLTFRADNIETALTVLGAHIEYFDVLDKSYGDLYQGLETASELSVRWEKTRASGAEILARVDPLVDAVPEARILRAAYNVTSTLRETSPDEQNAALASAIADLEISIKEDPEALDGLAQAILGQILVVLPEFLGGDVLRGIELLETANKMNPGDFSVYRSLAEAYLGEREDDKAIATLKAALAADPAGDNLQDYVDEIKFMGGLALRANQPDLAAAFAEKRSAVLAAHPELLTRKEFASFGHGGEDPITGKETDALTTE